MPMFESSGGDDHVAAAEDGGVAGEAVPGVDADERDEAGELGEVEEGEAVEARRPGAVGVARPAAAALGEEHDRQAQRLGELEQAVLLAVVLHALRAGEDRVVVGHGDAARPFPAEEVAVDRADAADQAVGGRVGDEVGEVAPAALGGDHQRAVLDERAVVDEVGDVLPRRAPVAVAAPGDGIGPGLVEPDAVALDRLGEIGSQCSAVAHRGPSRLVRLIGHVGDRLEHDESIAGHDGGPDADQQLGDAPVLGRRDIVMHLHRLDEHQHGARSDDVARRHLERHDRALQRTSNVRHVTVPGPAGSTRPCAAGPRAVGSSAPSRAACGPA